ncbi:DsbA family protein [Flavobacterium sp. Sd200]|uniref:DsbA family protein n=1 Tax=Flavobacterium sp. Sd200 TaxID=2692211 RepID=UPI00136FF4D6|nr:DsbA family protein [Flavobacterium sp. Sd200]MXN92880.1 DsbA family protein [Flavobacterium sp. Sd200]
MSDVKNNPLLCDPETGACEMPGMATNATGTEILKGVKPVNIVYYTDPICSSCWGIEPQLRKLKLEYGQYFEIDYRMGGLLPDWSYNSGGISKPSDVAHHWDEASLYYQMPIDGDVWLEDPLHSSYPSCIAVKAAQIQDKQKAVIFMRILREGLFIDKKNIAKWENIVPAAEKAGLDVAKLKEDYDGTAQRLFKEDLLLGRKLGVRGFPTLFFSDGNGNQLTVNGSKPYQHFENALKAIYPDVKKNTFEATDPLALFKHYPTLTVREYAEILDKSQNEAKQILEELYASGVIGKKTIKSGSLFLKK